MPRQHSPGPTDGRSARTLAHPTFNRGDSITKPLAVTASIKATGAQRLRRVTAAQTGAGYMRPCHTPAIVTAATVAMTIQFHQAVDLARAPVTQVHASDSPRRPPCNFTRREAPGNYNARTGQPTKRPCCPARNHASPPATYHPQSVPAPGPQREESPAPAYHPQ